MLEFGPQAHQGAVDVGDVAAVGDAGQAAGPPVRGPLEVEDQGVGAVVQELGGQGAQDGRGAATGAGADQDMRGVGVQVDADRLPVGGETDQDQGGGQRFQLLADSGVGQTQRRGRGGGRRLRQGVSLGVTVWREASGGHFVQLSATLMTVPRATPVVLLDQLRNRHVCR